MAQPLPNPTPNQNPNLTRSTNDRGNRAGVSAAEQRRRDQFIPKDHTPEEQAAESRRIYDQEVRAGVRANYQPEDIGIEGARRSEFDALTHSATEVAAESNRRAEYDTNYVSWLINSQAHGGVDAQGNATGEFGQGVGDPNYRGSGDPTATGRSGYGNQGQSGTGYQNDPGTGQIGMSNVGNRETRGYPANDPNRNPANPNAGPRQTGESDAAFEVRTRGATGQNPNDPRNPNETRTGTDPRNPQGARNPGETEAAFNARTRGANPTGDGTRIDDQGRRIDAQGRVIS